MSLSVNTNVGALVALQSLNMTNQNLQKTQKAVSTGYRIADATDDGAAFAVAQQYRANVQGYGAVSQQLQVASGTVNVALTATKSVSDLMSQAQSVLTKLADANVTGTTRTQYDTQLANINTQVSNFISGASLNGVNLVSSAATNLAVISNIDGTAYTVTAQDIQTNTTSGLAPVANAAAAAAALTGSFQTAMDTVNTAMNSLGADSNALTQQNTFINALSDATTQALGQIVDADMAKESASLQALQVQQQLATQTLSIANQSPQSLLKLFQ